MEIQKRVESRYEAEQNRAAFLILLFVVVVGIPVWWKSTEIPRAPLPYQEISDLPDLDFEFTFKFTLVKQEQIPEADILSFREDLVRIWDSVREYSNISLEIAIADSNPPTPNYNEIVIVLSHCSSSEEISLVDSSIDACWGDNTKQILLSFFHDYSQSLTSRRLQSKCLFPTVHGIQVSFTYILPFELRDAMLPSFYDDVDSFHEFGVLPLRKFVNATTDSQIYHFSTIPEFIHPEENRFYISQTNISQVVNKIESNLNSYTSRRLKINFLVYTPVKEYLPLLIQEDKTHKTFSSAGIEDWGSFLLTGNNIESNYTSILFRALEYLKFELKFPYVINNDMSLPGADSILTKPELNPWFYKQIHCYHSTAKRSLNALTQSLSEMQNIFINTDIQRASLLALQQLRLCREEYRRGRLEEAHGHCRGGWEQSEIAYYDPSIIQLLYFPEDQKYAIYVPLFLPIAAILLRSVPRLWRWLRGVES